MPLGPWAGGFFYGWLMSIAAATVWEVRTDGSDTLNGGGFNPAQASAGTDYSQQASAQVTYTDLVIDGALNTKVTSAANPFTSSHVGNLIVITGGTGFTTGRYEVVSVSGSTATLDRAVGTTGSTGGTGGLGGALASPGRAAALVVAGNDVWIRVGTYLISSSSTNVAGGLWAPAVGGVNSQNVAHWRGYGTVRGDGDGSSAKRPLIRESLTGANVTLFNSGADYLHLENLEVDCNSDATGLAGIRVLGTYVRILRCKVTGVSTGYGISAIGSSSTISIEVIECEVSGGTSGATGGINLQQAKAVGCYVHGLPRPGYILSASENALIDCISAHNTGGSSYGFDVNSREAMLVNCTAYGNGGAGFNITTSPRCSFIGCYAEANGGYGWGTSQLADGALLLRCGAYNNTSGNYNSAHFVAYDIVGFVTPAASALVDPINGDFTPNATAGAGALLRGAGGMGFIGTAVGSYRDIGAVRHADPAGGTAGARLVGPSALVSA
jgi:hypothetical protein